MLRIPIACALIVTALVSRAPSSSAPAITRVATLQTARSVHTATALRTGEVLVAGGMSGGAVTSAELFDPVANRTTPVASMHAARIGHTATLLPDGRVLIAGGYNGGYEASIEIFDPRTRQFTRAGTLREGRSGHTASLLLNGRVLFTGGVGRGWTFLRTAEIYDPVTAQSEMTTPMASQRESHTATVLPDGRVLVIGGHNGRRAAMEVYASTEIYDPALNRFASSGTLQTPRHKHDAILLGDGRVLIIGGADRTDRRYFSSTEIYDPRTQNFVRGPEMKNSRYKIIGTSAVLPDGNVVVTSGARTAELLDVSNMTFREVSGVFPDAYHFATATSLGNGAVLIIGGYAGSEDATAGIWRYR
jgi:hypothetical protein